MTPAESIRVEASLIGLDYTLLEVTVAVYETEGAAIVVSLAVEVADSEI